MLAGRAIALDLAIDSKAKEPANDAQRIIALSPHAVELLFAIGAGDRIVATTDYADYPEAAKQIPRIGGYYGIQLERVLELKPDLIVTWSGGNRAEDIARLEELGLPLFASEPKALADVADELEALGRLTGLEAKATAQAARYRDRLEQLRLDNKDKAKVKVFYQLWSEPLMTVASGSWVAQILEVCGADNVFANAKGEYPQVSLEAVLQTAPEVIIQTGDAGNVQLLDWSRWPEVPAVAKDRIYQLNADLLHRAGPRTIEGIAQVCTTLDQARSSAL
ncbi:cobalamin-binding protein [Shewanella cyperi]|uniref:Cobalamin-binding protein n=1 Tax=Shewanella cyperi TaxID=2814292 RepID=A0A974XP24_9GAMM|nr:cobalamin-binding protein [Shewanella cyperi]